MVESRCSEMVACTDEQVTQSKLYYSGSYLILSRWVSDNRGQWNKE